MIYRVLLVLCLIYSSIRYRTRPWNFFQLNRSYFDPEKKIFSKQQINDLIPDRFKLKQVVDDGFIEVDLPVFCKPEWGQNSHGVCLIKTQQALDEFRAERDGSVNWLIQEPAREKREFEIFYMRHPDNHEQFSLLSLTESVNLSGKGMVVNGVHNPDCSYRDLTTELTADEADQLWQRVREIGEFRVARVGLRSDDLNTLLDGEFHVIEINIFLPMPLALLDPTHSFGWKYSFICRAMDYAARLGRQMDWSRKRYPIFFYKLAAHYKVKT